MANGRQRDLAMICRDPVNFTNNLYKNCCNAALFYMYYTAGIGGLGSFQIALQGLVKNPAGLIAELARLHGTQRTRRFMMAGTPLQVEAGSVLVFKDDLWARHVCICGEANVLYGHNQGNWFKDCLAHGFGHCRHHSREIAWINSTEASNANFTCKIYTIHQDKALKWIKRVF